MELNNILVKNMSNLHPLVTLDYWGIELRDEGVFGQTRTLDIFFFPVQLPWYLAMDGFYYLFEFIGVQFDDLKVWYDGLDAGAQLVPWIFGGIFGIFFTIVNLVIIVGGIFLIVVLVSEEGDDIETQLANGWKDIEAWFTTAFDDVKNWFNENLGKGLGAMEDPNISNEAKCRLRPEYRQSIEDKLRCENGKVKEIWSEVE